MSGTLRRRLGALEARQAQREGKLRRRHMWWHADRGEPEPVAEPGEELHVYRWVLPDEEPPGVAGAKADEAAR
jgi:hypothetical protein